MSVVQWTRSGGPITAVDPVRWPSGLGPVVVFNLFCEYAIGDKHFKDI